MPSPKPARGTSRATARRASEATLAIARQLIVPAQPDEITVRIAGILQDVPEGILRAFCRHGVTICVRDNESKVYYDVRRRRLNVRQEELDGDYPSLKTALGWVFDHIVLADFVVQHGGKSEYGQSLLSSAAVQGRGLRDADRLMDCWRDGDTVSDYATKSVGHMFAAGFATFCTPGLREEFQCRAFGLFQLISEFADRYANEPLSQRPVRNLPADATDLNTARDYARRMLIGSYSALQREQVAQCLQYAPLSLLKLLDGHGVRIRLRSGKGPSTYDAVKRRVTLRITDPATLMHELGHALDHILWIETAQHDPEVRRAPRTRAEREVYKYRIMYLTQVGLALPGRYTIADALATHWHHAQKVSDYAKKDIMEWFAESFKASRDTGEVNRLGLGSYRMGDGTRATLVNRDSTFIPLLDHMLQRLDRGIDISSLEEIEPSYEPTVRYTHGQDVRGMQLRDSGPVHGLKVKLALQFTVTLVVMAACAALLAVFMGPIGTAVGVPVAVTVTAFYGLILRMEFAQRLRQRPLKERATVIRRRGNDWIVAQRADGTCMEVDRCLFSAFADSPRFGESIALTDSDGTLRALTERQMMPQTRGTWLSRRTAPATNIENLDATDTGQIAPPRHARDLRRKTVTGTFLGYVEARTIPWNKTGRKLFLNVAAGIVKVDERRVHGAARRLKPGEKIALVWDGRSSWRLLNQDRLALAQDTKVVAEAREKRLADTAGSSTRKPRARPRHDPMLTLNS